MSSILGNNLNKSNDEGEEYDLITQEETDQRDDRMCANTDSSCWIS